MKITGTDTHQRCTVAFYIIIERVIIVQDLLNSFQFFFSISLFLMLVTKAPSKYNHMPYIAVAALTNNPKCWITVCCSSNTMKTFTCKSLLLVLYSFHWLHCATMQKYMYIFRIGSFQSDLRNCYFGPVSPKLIFIIFIN